MRTNPDGTPEEIVLAAKIACAHDFIMTLPQGYNERVGERGSECAGLSYLARGMLAKTLVSNPQFERSRWSCSDIAAQLVALGIVVRDRHRHRMAIFPQSQNQLVIRVRLASIPYQKIEMKNPQLG